MTIYLILAMAAGRCVSPQANFFQGNGISFSPGVVQFPQCEYVAPVMDVEFTSSVERSTQALEAGARVFSITRGFTIRELTRSQKKVEYETRERPVDITSNAEPRERAVDQDYMVVGSSVAVGGEFMYHQNCSRK